LIREQTEKSLIFVHPPIFYQYADNESEAMTWEINQLMDSDIVIVNLSDISDSIGTHMELGVIDTVNKSFEKNIYTVGIGEPDIDHPWIFNSVFRREKTPEEAADFIVGHLLV